MASHQRGKQLNNKMVRGAIFQLRSAGGRMTAILKWAAEKRSSSP